MKNYGNEKDVYELLYPNPFNIRGLDDNDFEEKVDKESLREMLKNKTYYIPDDEFDTLYEITRQNLGATSDKVTFKAFLETVRNIKRDYLKYRTMFK